jgi:hypothetical protein
MSAITMMIVAQWLTLPPGVPSQADREQFLARMYVVAGWLPERTPPPKVWVGCLTGLHYCWYKPSWMTTSGRDDKPVGRYSYFAWPMSGVCVWGLPRGDGGIWIPVPFANSPTSPIEIQDLGAYISQR